MPIYNITSILPVFTFIVSSQCESVTWVSSSEITTVGDTVTISTIFNRDYHWFYESNTSSLEVELTSQWYSDFKSAVCLSRGDRAKTTWTPMNIIQDLETSHGKRSLGNFQHQYLPELLCRATTRYRVMVKFLAGCISKVAITIRMDIATLKLNN